MKAGEITESGFYWYRDPGEAWEIVHVVLNENPAQTGGPTRGIWVTGWECFEPFERTCGEFIGPLEPPLSEPA